MDILEKIFTIIGAVIIGFVVLALLSFILSFITLWAWNIFMPAIFHLPTINFWQAFAFNLLAGQFRSTVTTKK